MMKKIKKIAFLILLIIIIFIFIFIRYKSYTYETKYFINEYEIIEKYNTKDKKYTFYIKSDNKIFPYILSKKYIRNKELINEIKVYDNEKGLCILPISKKVDFYPVCYNDEEYTFYNLSNINIKDFEYNKITENLKQKDKIKIHYTNNQKFLLFNYNGFYYINEDSIKNIELFEKDIYTLDLIYQMNEYIIIPNYNENYYFTKFFVINMNNGKTKEINCENEISFTSKFLGDFKNKIYLLDKKEKKEYRIDINKLKIEEIEYTILKDNKLQKTNFNELNNNNLVFDNIPINTYDIKDINLYQKIDKYRILITNKKVDKIIKEEKDTIYYLVKDNLYMFNNIYGEVLLINNFEWNFNNTNMIYIL